MRKDVIDCAYIVHGFEAITEAVRLWELGSRFWMEKFDDKCWRYRSPWSCGSNLLLASGMSARLHNAARRSYPLWRARVSVLKVFLRLGYPATVLGRLSEAQARKYPCIYSKLVGLLLRAFRARTPTNVSILLPVIRHL